MAKYVKYQGILDKVNDNNIAMISKSEILLYTAKDGEVKIEVLYNNQNIWLMQKKMAALFCVQTPAINKHLKNIFESGELKEESAIFILETITKKCSSVKILNK